MDQWIMREEGWSLVHCQGELAATAKKMFFRGNELGRFGGNKGVNVLLELKTNWFLSANTPILARKNRKKDKNPCH